MGFRSTLRSLRRSPAFTLTAALVLGLGLGANFVLFNAVYALLLRPLPFPDPDRLFALRHRTLAGAVHISSSGRHASDIREGVKGLAEIGLVTGGPSLALRVGDETVDVEVVSVNAGYLRALGLRPVAGRLFGDEEDLNQTPETRALLMEDVWRRQYGGDPSIIGRLLPCRTGGVAGQLRIVGVLPRVTLPYMGEADVLAALPWRIAAVAGNRSNMSYQTVIRVRPDADPAAVSAQVTAVLSASQRELPERQRGQQSWLEPLRTVLVGSFKAPVWLLYGAAGLLLLLTTVNVASLFLARALVHAQEAAVRNALGATPGRILRDHLLEASLVCLAGSAIGFGFASAARPVLPRFVPELTAVGPAMLNVDLVFALAALGVTLLVAASIAVLPVLQARRASLSVALAQGGRSSTGRTSPLRGALAVSQLAIILVLLALGTLVVRSFVQASRTDPGFDPSGVVTCRVSLPASEEARTSAARELQAALAALPGVVDVAFSGESPIGTYYSAMHSARPGAFQATDPMVAFRLVDPRYFRTLRARLVRGRTFTDADVDRPGTVAILNESASRLLFEGSDPIGRVLHSGIGNRQLTVVGLLADIKTAGLDREAPPMLYFPYLPYFGSSVVYSIRTTADAAALEGTVRRRVRSWNEAAGVADYRVLERAVQKTVQRRLRASVLLGGFAMLGLVVGSVGLYGTISAQVERLTREIGVRVALGATMRSVIGGVLREGARLLVIGTVAGLALSAAAARLIREQLYGVEALDPWSFAAAVGLLSVAALLATLLPAVRAARIDPVQALRN